MVTLQRNALRVRPFWIPLFAAALALLTPSSQAQTAPHPGTSDASAVVVDGFLDASASDQAKNRMLREMALERNDLRQNTIVDEAGHLLALAQPLKAAVDQSDKNRLSLEAIHTAAQVEKLAKTVEKKMRETN